MTSEVISDFMKIHSDTIHISFDKFRFEKKEKSHLISNISVISGHNSFSENSILALIESISNSLQK